MRLKASIISFIFVAGLFAIPIAAHAAIPFLGPIIPEAYNRCAAGFGLFMIVINNIISFLITIVIVFVAPIMIAYSGFLFVTNPVNASGKEDAKRILTNTVVGIVIALAGWMIVNAIMAVLYNPDAKSGQTTLGVWSSLIRTQGADICLPLKASRQNVPGTNLEISGVASKFTFDDGIDAQIPDASPALSNLLACMVSKVPAGVGRISSISDSFITSGQKTFQQCAGGACQHAANSCHYGGKACIGESYAVDFGDENNMNFLIPAAEECGGVTLNEGDHLHVSVGAANGCQCGV